MYSPYLGRFVQQDPIGFDGGTPNWYEFVNDNPINESDPSGLAGRPTSSGGVPDSSLPKGDKQFPEKYKYAGQTKVAIVTDSVPGVTESYPWVPKEDTHSRVKNLRAVADIIDKYPDGSIDVLYVSGHRSPEAGARFLEYEDVRKTSDSFDQKMPGDIAMRIAKKLSPNAKVVLLSCRSAENPDLLKSMGLLANKLQATVIGNSGDVGAVRDKDVLANGEWKSVAPSVPNPEILDFRRRAQQARDEAMKKEGKP